MADEGNASYGCYSVSSYDPCAQEETLAHNLVAASPYNRMMHQFPMLLWCSTSRRLWPSSIKGLGSYARALGAGGALGGIALAPVITSPWSQISVTTVLKPDYFFISDLFRAWRGLTRLSLRRKRRRRKICSCSSSSLRPPPLPHGFALAG